MQYPPLTAVTPVGSGDIHAPVHFESKSVPLIENEDGELPQMKPGTEYINSTQAPDAVNAIELLGFDA